MTIQLTGAVQFPPSAQDRPGNVTRLAVRSMREAMGSTNCRIRGEGAMAWEAYCAGELSLFDMLEWASRQER
jgi:hypothetical protein